MNTRSLPQSAVPLELTDQLDYKGRRKHVFSHRVWNMECYRGLWNNQVNEALPEHCFWIAEDQLDTIPIVGAHRKWLNVVLAEEAGSTPEKAEPRPSSRMRKTSP